MLKQPRDIVIADVRKRAAEGDFPTTPAHSIETLENVILDLSSTPKRDEEQAGEVERLKLDLEALRRREVQMMGAAISTRNWHDMENAYNQLRDKIDRELTRAKRAAS